MADPSKTEKATPKKRRDERKKGHVAMSRDAVSVATLIGSCAVFFMTGSVIVEEAGSFIRLCFMKSGEIGSTEELMSGLFTQGVSTVATSVLPILLTTVACAVAATFFQTKMLVSWELMKVKFSHINPIEGFKRLFSLKSLIEALKGILKISILLIVIYISLRDGLLETVKYLYTDISAACAHMLDTGKGMMIRIIIAFVVLAAADAYYQWWSFERDMRMSKEEVKEEYKQLEGDPKVKAKIREIQRRRALSRMMQQVPEADVVIRNPTHYAVALRYKPESDNAPVVLAKGQDELALRIVQIAQESGVAVMENVSLARALYAQTELNQEIPQELYGAVAEVLVYIFRLNDNKQLVR